MRSQKRQGKFLQESVALRGLQTYSLWNCENTFLLSQANF